MISKFDLIGMLSTVALVVGIIYAYANPAPSVDNSNRREYVYCPVTPDSFPKSTSYEIDGCPTVRVYVYNWNSLSALDQSTIDTQLKSSGFKDPDQLKIPDSGIINNTVIAQVK